ncbi:hypothetical protein GCM10020331_062540 [Ectobacillus funiculus]
MNGKLLVIGFGPGSFEHITERAREALQESDVIIGYKNLCGLDCRVINRTTNRQHWYDRRSKSCSRSGEAS